MKLNKITTALSVALLGSAIAIPTYAAEDEKQSGLEVIEVTATKRVTTMKETPLSMEAISGDDIASRGLDNLEDLTTSVPNITIGSGLGVQTVSMRGMGSGNERSFEQSVGMFIDGLYMPRSRQYRAPFFDAERVEMLRGPQAVLYGLNSTAGTITVTSASTLPGDEAFLNLSAGYEVEYAGYNVSAVTGGSLGDDVGARLAVRYTDNGDGFYYNEYENALTGQEAQDEGDGDEIVARGTIVWDASDNLQITTKFDYADAETFGETGEAIKDPFGGGDEADWVRNASSTLSGAFNDRGPGMYHELSNLSLTADYTMGEHILTAVLGHSTSDYSLITNTAVVPMDALTVSINEDYSQTSGEFRITSPDTGNFSYIAGLYVSESELENNLDSALGDALLGGLLGGMFGTTNGIIGGRFTNMLDTTTISPFVTGTYKFSDSFKITAGLRYSNEEKDVARRQGDCNIMQDVNGTGDFTVAVPLSQLGLADAFGFACGTLGTAEHDVTKDSDNFMPEIIAQWNLAGGASTYAKVSRSAKSGGYGFSSNTPTLDLLEYDDEIATSFEVGYKTTFAEGNGQFNIAVFNTTYEDLQLNSFTMSDDGVPQAAVNNAGESISQGFEADIKYLLTDSITIGTSIAYLSSEYEEWENAPCSASETATGLGPFCEREGMTTPFAPETSGNLFIDVFQPIGDELFLTGGINVAYSDEYFTEGTLDEAAVQDSYTRVDARIGITNDDNWSVSIVGKNLTEEEINNFTQPLVGFVVVPGAPRTVTVQGTYNF
ncbi:TonB-dependent receptor [Thalassotalea psychrophila]|uniref:TonB-dependent receptor n=1 Tax=Thalassotalea psychrophila TaxID=3065647 RepID=A0ABY9TZJ9_9GAMM|nr:TonB-dependent receptor [Colwelliaceae bacterium SQ149]